MKRAPNAFTLAVALQLVHVYVPVHAYKLASHMAGPVKKVLVLMKDLKKSVETDGKLEQKMYDKYACWCERTLESKSNAMTTGKADTESLQTLINKLKGDLGKHGAEIKNLKKQIAKNLDEQKEATTVRDKENADFEAEKLETEQCIGALESGIKVLTGSGSGTFLQTMQDAELLAAAASVKRALQSQDLVARTTSEEDLKVVMDFVQRPVDFVHPRAAGAMSAVQERNPYGDYAPQSTQIQGILKGMYESFTLDLEKANGEEAEAQKTFEALMATKKSEQATLEETLEVQTMDESAKTKQLADSKAERDDIMEQVKADSTFFDETKVGCQQKAIDWADRSRIRSDELKGISDAIKILECPESQEVFNRTVEEAAESSFFLQVSARSSRKLQVGRAKSKGQLAVTAGGHFDKVVTMIDQMVKVIRKEEKNDIAHRDRCQNSISKNTNDIAELEHVLLTTQESIQTMEDTVKEKQEAVQTLERDISDTKFQLDEILSMRNKEHIAFTTALKDDETAIKVINGAIGAMGEIPSPCLLQTGRQRRSSKDEPDVEYTVDTEKAPEMPEGSYEGKKSEGGGILKIMEVIVQDIEKDVDAARKEDALAQKQYEEDRAGLRKVEEALKATKVANEKEMADLTLKISDAKARHISSTEGLEAQTQLKATLAKDCKWVETSFQSRRDKRKVEIAGLAEAKNVLAGASKGDYDALNLETAA